MKYQSGFSANSEKYSIESVLEDLAESRASLRSELSKNEMSAGMISVAQAGKTDGFISVSGSLGANPGYGTTTGGRLESAEPKTISVKAGEGTYVPYVMPQAEYMYGCTATAVGMLFGYYDKFGYLGFDVSDLIAGDVELNARGLDGNEYNMNAFDTVLGSAIASERHVAEFYEQTPEHEYKYSFKEGTTEILTESWDCLADYMGTNQFWRGNDDLASTYWYQTGDRLTNLAYWLSAEGGKTVTSGTTSIDVSYKNSDFLCGLYYYAEAKGYSLDTQASGTFLVDGNNGKFTFEDYMAEIDAGRAVIVQIEGHSMTGYGYDVTTREIIVDDTYRADQRMKWDGTYNYSGADRDLLAITVIAFDSSNLKPLDDPEEGAPEKPVVTADIVAPTQGNVTLTVAFDSTSVLNEYSYDGIRWYTYTDDIVMTDNGRIFFRSTNGEGKTRSIIHTVDNIDRVAPEKPLISVSTHEQTGDPVKVFAIFSTDSDVREYSFDGVRWFAYDAGVTMMANGLVMFRSIDRAGNIGDIAYYEVNNITGTPRGSVISDFNGDGKSDLLFAGQVMGDLWVWGGGNVTNGKYVGSTNLAEFRVAGIGDFNGDRKADILWQGENGMIGLWQDGDAGRWQVIESVDSSKAKVSGVGDFNGDGRSDILWRMQDGTVGYWQGDTTEWRYMGKTNSDWAIAGIGDFDGNGRADIIWKETSGNAVGLWMNGTDQWNFLGLGDSSKWKIIGTGNFDNSCRDSIVWNNAWTGEVGVWAFDLDGNKSWQTLGVAGGNWSASGIGDFDGNGVSDILWTNRNTGEVGCWLDGDSMKWRVLGNCSTDYKPMISVAG